MKLPTPKTGPQLSGTSDTPPRKPPVGVAIGAGESDPFENRRLLAILALVGVGRQQQISAAEEPPDEVVQKAESVTRQSLLEITGHTHRQEATPGPQQGRSIPIPFSPFSPFPRISRGKTDRPIHFARKP